MSNSEVSQRQLRVRAERWIYNRREEMTPESIFFLVWNGLSDILCARPFTHQCTRGERSKVIVAHFAEDVDAMVTAWVTIGAEWVLVSLLVDCGCFEDGVIDRRVLDLKGSLKEDLRSIEIISDDDDWKFLDLDGPGD